MRFLHLFGIAAMALSAAAADGPSAQDILHRINGLTDQFMKMGDLGYKLGKDKSAVSDFLDLYKAALLEEQKDNSRPMPTEPYQPYEQSRICHSYEIHMKKGLAVEKHLLNNLDEFKEDDQQEILLPGQMRFAENTDWFVTKVAPIAIPDCLDMVKQLGKEAQDKIKEVIKEIKPLG